LSYRIFVTGAGIADEAHRYLQAEGCLVQLGDPGDSPADIARKLEAFVPTH
jgi:hypothetical protein